MNYKILFSIFIFFVTVNLKAQKSLEAFANLVPGTWISEGKQLGGHEGKAEKIYEWGLNEKLVKVKTYTTDPKTLKFDLRNEGVRFWKANDELIHFYEFDAFGGITEGTVTINEKDIHYDYEYEGYKLRDSWIYVNADTYKYIVGVWEDGAWKEKFHEGQFIRKD